MSSLQPPPLPLLKMVGATIALWFQDTWNKLKNLQTSASTALYISGLTIQNNTPSGASISWSACTVWYNGAAYQIAAGSTNALMVWWTVGATTFSSGSTFTPGPTTFGILSNNQGTADTIWNKVGSAAVQASNVNLQAALYNGPNGVMFTDVVFTDNPGTGVNWSGGTVYYKGRKYAISSGSTDNTKFWIYWRLSNPNVFQLSATYPALGADDFLLGINGSSGNPATLGHFERTFELRQANGQTVYLTAGGSIFAYNSQGGEMYSLGRSSSDGVGAPGYGSLNLFDGHGGRNIVLDGSAGTWTTPFGISPLSGGSAGYLPLITQGGTTYKIQIFNP